MRLFGKEQQSEQARKDAALHEKLAGHEVKPPSYLWDAVEEKLPQGKRGRGTLLYYVMPLAACIIAAIVLMTISGGEGTAGKSPMIGKYNKGNTGNNTHDIVSSEKGAPAVAAPSQSLNTRPLDFQNDLSMFKHKVYGS